MLKQADISASCVQHCGSDLSVVNAARVSFNKESDFLEDGTLRKGDVGLIKYLADHKHFSPFNHAFLTFRIKAPVFVARQLVKHKFMPWNEVSRRYVDDEPEFYFPELWRKSVDNVKQGSNDKEFVDFVTILPQIESALQTYQELLQRKVAPEMARMVLPQNMMTEWFWSGTLGAYADMLKLRLDPHTQYESRIVANLIFKEIKQLFPVSTSALLKDFE